MIDVVVNGAARRLLPGTTVADLVADLGCGPRGVAVAVNSELVAHSAWGETPVAPGDRIEVLQAAQGG